MDPGGGAIGWNGTGVGVRVGVAVGVGVGVRGGSKTVKARMNAGGSGGNARDPRAVTRRGEESIGGRPATDVNEIRSSPGSWRTT